MAAFVFPGRPPLTHLPSRIGHVTDADIIPFERGVRLLRGVEAERERKARIRECWVDARRRAFNGIVYESDVGLFGLAALEAELAPYLKGRPMQVMKYAAAAEAA